MSQQTAILVGEGEMGDRGVMRVILVPSTIVSTKFQRQVAALAAYGRQCVDFIGPDECRSLKAVKAIFDEMNPPDADDDQDGA